MSPKGVKGLVAFWRIVFLDTDLIGYFFLLFYIHFLVLNIIIITEIRFRCTKTIPTTLLNYTPVKLLQWISSDLGWGWTHPANKIYIQLQEKLTGSQPQHCFLLWFFMFCCVNNTH